MAIKLGIVGLSASPSAWATITHVGPLKQAPLSKQYKLTAVATSSPETAKAAAESQGLPEHKAYSGPEEIAKDKDVAMVTVFRQGMIALDIQSPHYWRKIMLKQISKRLPITSDLPSRPSRPKKYVLVEWPLAAKTYRGYEHLRNTLAPDA